jgi:predicted PurR-regulated permease PerM
MKPYSNPQQHYMIIAFLAILAVALIYTSWIIFDGIMGAIIFFAIFRRLHIYLTTKRKWKAGLSCMLIILGSFMVLIVPFITLIWMVASKIIYYETNPEEMGILKEKLWPLIQKYISNKKNADAIVNGIQSKVFLVFSNVLNGIANTALQIAVMYFLLYFMLKEYKKFEATIVRYLPLKKTQILRLGEEFSNITNSNFLGQSFICLVQGSLISIGFLIFGVPDALFWGVVCFFISFVPIIGAPLIFVPAAVLLIAGGNTFNGVALLLWGFILVTNIDNLIRYYLAKKIGDIHPLITIIGVVIGIPAFGILGLVYGPLLISYFVLIFKIWEANNKADEELTNENTPS